MADQVLSKFLKRIEIVCIFAADIVPTDEPLYAHLGWRSGRGLEQDKTGPVFSYERVLAAAALYRMNPSLRIIPSGGYTNTNGGKRVPPISTVIAFELNQLGVPQSSIIEESLSTNTQDQITCCGMKMWAMGLSPERVAVIAPCWQFGRINAMMSNGDSESPFRPGITPLISMERALAAEDPAWNARFAGWYSTPEAREMFAMEALGTGQLWAGHQPKYPNPFRGFNDPLA